MFYTSLTQLPAKEIAIWDSAHVGSDGKRRRLSRQLAGRSSTAWATPEEYLEEVSLRLARWQAGYYEIIEVAQIVADSNPQIDAISFCHQIEDAAHCGELTIRINGVPVAAIELEKGRIMSTEVRQTDVNEWLQSIKAGYELVYPYADVQDRAAPVVAEGDGSAKSAAPTLKQPAQENRILELLKSRGYDPLNLRERQPGKSGAKALIKTLALLEPSLFTAKTFNTAWERVRGDGRIAGGE